jgi:predicted transposase/invertase (TIGR01784 family)
MEILERMPWAAQNAVFQRLADIAEVSKLNKEERLEYDHALKRYRDTLNAMNGAELKGIEKGRAEGEKNKAIEVARNLKAMGLSADDIVKVTGLTAEELKAL